MSYSPLTSEHLRRLLAEAEASGCASDITEKLKWFLHYAEQGKSVAETCAAFNISRSTFHRWAQRFNPADLKSLEEKPSRPLTIRQRTVSPAVVELIRGYRQAEPFEGKERIAQRLLQDHGIALSSSTVGRVISEQNLFFGDTPLHFKHRTHHFSAPAEATATKVEFAEQKRGKISWIHALKRALIATSIAMNLALLGMAATTALWEVQNVQGSVQQDLHTVTTSGSLATPASGTTLSGDSEQSTITRIPEETVPTREWISSELRP